MSLTYGMFSARFCMKFDFLSIRAIKSQLDLSISNIFSSNLSKILRIDFFPPCCHQDGKNRHLVRKCSLSKS